MIFTLLWLMETKFILTNGIISTHQNSSKNMDLCQEHMFNNLFVTLNLLLSQPELKLTDKFKESIGSSANNHHLILMHLMYLMPHHMDQPLCNGKETTILFIYITNIMLIVSKSPYRTWKSIQPIRPEKKKNTLLLLYPEEPTIKQ